MPRRRRRVDRTPDRVGVVVASSSSAHRARLLAVVLCVLVAGARSRLLATSATPGGVVVGPSSKRCGATPGEVCSHRRALPASGSSDPLAGAVALSTFPICPRELRISCALTPTGSLFSGGCRLLHGPDVHLLFVLAAEATNEKNYAPVSCGLQGCFGIVSFLLCYLWVRMDSGALQCGAAGKSVSGDTFSAALPVARPEESEACS